MRVRPLLHSKAFHSKCRYYILYHYFFLFREIANKIDTISKVIDVCKRGKEILENIWKEIGLNEEQKLMRNERFFDLIASKMLIFNSIVDGNSLL